MKGIIKRTDQLPEQLFFQTPRVQKIAKDLLELAKDLTQSGNFKINNIPLVDQKNWFTLCSLLFQDSTQYDVKFNQMINLSMDEKDFFTFLFENASLLSICESTDTKNRTSQSNEILQKIEGYIWALQPDKNTEEKKPVGIVRKTRNFLAHWQKKPK